MVGLLGNRIRIKSKFPFLHSVEATASRMRSPFVSVFAFESATDVTVSSCDLSVVPKAQAVKCGL